jgi:hypothetical protein
MTSQKRTGIAKIGRTLSFYLVWLGGAIWQGSSVGHVQRIYRVGRLQPLLLHCRRVSPLTSTAFIAALISVPRMI